MIYLTLKEEAVKFKGSQCVLCGYNSCNRALHFHHLNSHEKEKNISNYTNWQKLVAELEKCVLVCANCHAEIHSGMVDHEILYEFSLV
jgi:hypothetical protein